MNKPTTTWQFASYLGALGVRRVFVYPGGTNVRWLPVFAQAGFEIITAGPEGLLGYYAMGETLVSGVPAVVLVISGPGVMNAVPALFASAVMRLPFILIEGLPRGANFARHCVQDTSSLCLSSVRVTHPITGCSFELTSPEAAATALEKAASHAFRKRLPAHLAVAADLSDFVPSESTRLSAGRASSLLRRITARRCSRVDLAAVASCANLITGCTKVTLLLGRAPRTAKRVVVELAERLNAPFLVTIEGKGHVDERHELCAGVALAGNPLGEQLIQKAELLLCVGSPPGEFELYGYRIGSEKKAIVVRDEEPEHEPYFDDVHVLEGDIEPTLRALLDQLPAPSGGAEAQPWWHALRGEHPRTFSDQRLEGEEGKFVPSEVVSALQEVLPEDVAVVVDIGCSLFASAHNLRLGYGQLFYCPLQSAAVGQSIAHAVGVSLAHGGLTVCVAGDLALRDSAAAVVDAMNLQHRRGGPLRLVFLVLNDGHSGLVRAGVNELSARRQEPMEVVTENGPYEISVRGQANGEPPALLEVNSDSPVELRAALEKAVNTTRPMLLIVRTGTGTPPIGARNDQFGTGRENGG